MKRFAFTFGVLCALILPALAQSPVYLGLQTANGQPAGGLTFNPISSGNPLPVTGSFSASLSGFRPVAYGTPISVTTGGVTGTLPTNTGQVVATNVGATNGAYCALGASATTSSQYIAPNGGWFGFAISGDTQLTCITATSTTTVNLAGGSGLPTGTGGGGGGGGSSGAVFGPTAVGSAAANPPVLSGGTADGTATGNVGVWKIVSGVGSENLAQVNAVTVLTGSGAVGTGAQRVAVGADSAVLAGSILGLTSGNPLFVQLTSGTALAGKFGIDQTTVGSTNGVSIAQIGATTVATGNGVVGTGVQRVAIASDNTANSNPWLVNPGTAANWGVGTSTQNSATVANGQLALAQFNTTPTTITSGNMSPFQLDANGNLLVNVKAGGGSGGTSSAFGSAFPSTGTAIGLTNGTNMVAWSATSNYGTAPSAIAVPAVNAYVTNTIAALTIAGQSASPVATFNGASKYNTVAASQTAQALTGGGGGATGDYLSHCDIIPATTAPGVVTILDNATSIVAFPGGGTTPLSNLVPFSIPLGAVSTSGAWKVTTGANVSVVCVGKFT